MASPTPAVTPAVTPAATPGIAPDTKDWTWVLDRRCPECGYTAAGVSTSDLGRRIREDAEHWRAVGADHDAQRLTTRPRADSWSVTEYACHVRDVHRVFADRVAAMLGHDGVGFANWDQDRTAVESRYDLAAPGEAIEELVSAALAVADAYDAVPPAAWAHRGVRSNGSAFDIASLGAYHLHDVVHHRWDVQRILGG